MVSDRENTSCFYIYSVLKYVKNCHLEAWFINGKKIPHKLEYFSKEMCVYFNTYQCEKNLNVNIEFKVLHRVQCDCSIFLYLDAFLLVLFKIINNTFE